MGCFVRGPCGWTCPECSLRSIGHTPSQESPPAPSSPPRRGRSQQREWWRNGRSQWETSQEANHLSPQHTRCTSAGFRLFLRPQLGREKLYLRSEMKLGCETSLDFPYLKMRCLLIPGSDQGSLRICAALHPGKWKNNSTEGPKSVVMREILSCLFFMSN